MKMFLLSFLCVFLGLITQAQIFYSQGFNISLAASGWTNTNLTTPWGNGSAFSTTNQWIVDDLESGRPPNICGIGGTGNPSLYMGASGSIGGLGAAYLSNARTNRRISSPNISTIGKTNITLSFNFIGSGGTSTSDKAYFQYSINGGGTWITPTNVPTTTNPALPIGSTLNLLRSQICGSGQGRWTNVTWNLPVTTENISNFRLAFVWQNQSPPIGGSAGDPSFAVDDITLSTPIPTPITLVSFTGKEFNSTSNLLEWATSSEINNEFFTIERSTDAINFEPIGTIKGAGNSNTMLRYKFFDQLSTFNFQHSTVLYYRLKQTDFDGKYEYFDVIAISRKNTNKLNVFYYNKQLYFLDDLTNEFSVTVLDITGRIVYENKQATTKVNLDFLKQGIYIYQLRTNNTVLSDKIIVQ